MTQSGHSSWHFWASVSPVIDQAGMLNRVNEISVKAHRGRVMEKTHAGSLPELV